MSNEVKFVCINAVYVPLVGATKVYFHAHPGDVIRMDADDLNGASAFCRNADGVELIINRSVRFAYFARIKE